MLHELSIRTSAQECLVDITDDIQRVVRESGVAAGVALLYIPHTTCRYYHPGKRRPWRAARHDHAATADRPAQ